MPSVLSDYQHELCDVDGNDGVVFGTQDTGYLTTTYPTIAGGDLRSADQDRPQEDGTQMGRDYIGSKTLTFEMYAMADAINGLGGGNPHRAGLDLLDALEARWTDPVWRRTPWAMAMLRSCVAGRLTRCYGRPRRWDEATGNLTKHGYTPVVADFKLIDSTWYSDEEFLTEVGLDPAPSGGFFAPLVAPITTVRSTSAQGVVSVAGRVPTWPVIEFYGPVSQPRLQIGDVTVGIDGTLAYDQVAVIDPRPWVRTVTRRPDGAGIAGLLSRDTPPMRDLLLVPGDHDITYSGRDETGSTYARVKWRTAYKRP